MISTHQRHQLAPCGRGDRCGHCTITAAAAVPLSKHLSSGLCCCGHRCMAEQGRSILDKSHRSSRMVMVMMVVVWVMAMMTTTTATNCTRCLSSSSYSSCQMLRSRQQRMRCRRPETIESRRQGSHPIHITPQSPLLGPQHLVTAHYSHGARLVQLPHVLLQVKVPAEALGADLARVRLLVVVRVHVEGQIVDLVEGLVADVALVRLVPAVRQLVVLVVALLVEPLAAVLAHERLVACVDPSVRIQCGRPVEGLSTGVTLVWLLGRVDDLVSAQGARLAEALAADLADKRTGSCVNGHVTSQVVVGVEDLSALLTGKRLLFAIRSRGSTAGRLSVAIHRVDLTTRAR